MFLLESDMSEKKGALKGPSPGWPTMRVGVWVGSPG